MTARIAHQRLVAGAAVAPKLSWQPVDGDGEPADPGAVTVEVLRSDGTTLLAAGTATTGSAEAPRQVALTVAQAAQIDLLTARWTASGTLLAETLHELVGGVYSTLGQIRIDEPTLVEIDAARLRREREGAERTVEENTHRAFVPRFTVERLDGSGRCALTLGNFHLRRIRWARVIDGTTTTAFTVGELAAIAGNEAGIAVRGDGQEWPAGRGNIEVGYEHGLDRPPEDLRRATSTILRLAVNGHRIRIDDIGVPVEGMDPDMRGVYSALKRHRWDEIGVG